MEEDQSKSSAQPGEIQSQPKITTEQQQLILDLHRTGYGTRPIAKRTGLNRKTVQDALRKAGKQVTLACPDTPPQELLFLPGAGEIGARRDGRPHIAHRWVPDPDLAPIILQAFTLRAAGASMAEVHKATALYNSLNSYTTFFSNKLYIGILVFGDQVIENYCEPIVDLDTWQTVQLRVQQHAAHRNLTEPGSRSHPRRQSSRYLLSGLAYCARCGSPLYGLTSTQRNREATGRYACTRAHRRRDCDLRPIPQPALEAAVLETLQSYILQPDVQLANLELIQAQQADHFKVIDAQKADLARARELLLTEKK